MDYDLSRLSTRSFEQLVQALALAVIGPGIVIFGDGPDGGREATFNGRINFPSPTDPWDGYGVVQAKFRQRPEGSGKDGDWALTELKNEMEKFADGERNLRKPDYYLFVTNVVLTPVADVGSKDKLTNYLEGQQSNLGLKDFRIWDYDQLRVLLDGQTDVRTAYTAWITSGDVLAEVLKNMQPRQQDFRAVMRNFMQKELCANQYVNLNQAGHSTKERIPLAQVFVDLPMGDQQKSDRAIAMLQVLAAQRLDPRSNEQEPGKTLSPVMESKSQTPGRVVFIGGPGQGKSTLSQFLCQLHRVALLKLEEQILLEPEAKEACKLICQQSKHESLELPQVPRFPVRIELNRFAASLADGKASSLFDFLLKRIRLSTERELSADDLRDWLAAYPWLLVLDGLDEVPASSNRSEVLTSIQNFLVDAQGCNADLMLVATTRPQGYNDDFSPQYYRHTQLLPLDVPSALHYANRLVEQRWGGDTEKVEKLMQRLQRAGAEEATARLMQSPLQVTIMALLVETIGQPPRERWRLFNEYYQVIFRREKERDIPAAELLNSYHADIDAIHQQVGLRLQADSERAGGTEALLLHDEFVKLVNQRLDNEGHQGKEKGRLQKAIINAALERLVFLVAPEADKVGFEIRSLQEFMAAQCLMNGSDEDVRCRLRAIAPAAHWRNVFLFAAGRCFHDKQHLRDSLYALCAELNEGDGVASGGELEKATLTGSRLALDLLEDGALTRQPAQLKTYTRLAMRLLELPPCPEQLRLAKIYSADLEVLYIEEINKRLTDGKSEQRLGAWRMLLQLVHQDVTWAQSMAENHWPADAEEAIRVIKSADGVEINDWIAGHWATAITKALPNRSNLRPTNEWSSRIISKNANDKLPAWFYNLFLINTNTKHDVKIESIDSNYLNSLNYISNINCLKDFSSLSTYDIRKEWIWLAQAVNFTDTCSKEYLAELLLELSTWSLENRKSLERFIGFYYNLPWVIHACLVTAKDNNSLSYLANAALTGAMGNMGDWKKAEERWDKYGITISDLLYNHDSQLPFDREIAEKGFPFILTGALLTYSESNFSIALQLYDLWCLLPVSIARKRIAEQIFFVMTCVNETNEKVHTFTSTIFKELAIDTQEINLNWELLETIPENFWTEVDGIEAIEILGNSPQILSYKTKLKTNVIERLEFLISSYPNKVGLQRLLSIACIFGHKPKCSNAIICLDRFSMPTHRAATLLIKIAQANWQEAEAIQLAEMLGDLGDISIKTIGNALRIIEKQEMTGRPVETFLIKLYSTLPSTAWETRRDILRVMQEQQRRRLGNTDKLLSN